MSFNSIEFAILLLCVFVLYWFIFKQQRKQQNILILIASYIFYGWWDWRFLILIFVSSLSAYILGIHIDKKEDLKSRKLLLALSIVINLGIFSFFKYFNFFVDSFVDLLNLLGININYTSLHIILPIGISFYTFQTLSYTIDIFRKEFKPTSDAVVFFVYVSFFPQLVAGPIERARRLIPQFEKDRVFNLQKALDGMRQILWGLFKKIVIADNLSMYVDRAFANYADLPSSLLVISVVLFSFQIYCDFSGYSDIAIGTARLLGFNLMQNFRFPHFSTNITDLWRRWHISLSTWLRDYLFTPLAIKYRDLGKVGIAISIMVTFVLCGLWHGARWTFIFFGFLQGIALIYEFLSTKRRKRIRKKVNPILYTGVSIFLTFIFWQFCMIFFRAASLKNAFGYLSNIFTPQLKDFSLGTINLLFDNMAILKAAVFLPFFMIMEIIFRNKQHALAIENTNKFIRLGLYIFISLSILLFSPVEASQFIYFQF
jgi:alginate O-acetyltransferase complex protein AlgI